MAESMYDLSIHQTVSMAPSERRERRRRARQRLHGTDRQRTERLAACLVAAGRGEPSGLERWFEEERVRVHTLERRARARSESDRRSGATIRRTLELLRSYSRLLASDLSRIPEDRREPLLAILKLEHRYCYAAGGTTREDFEAAVGRTGAR